MQLLILRIECARVEALFVMKNTFADKRQLKHLVDQIMMRNVKLVGIQ